MAPGERIECWQRGAGYRASVHSLEPVDPDVDLHVPLDRGELVRHHGSVLAAIAIGGAVGALARQFVQVAMPTSSGSFPWATFAINVSGCLLIGMLMALLRVLPAHHRLLRPFLGVGVLGGFTTFSTYAVQSYELAGSGHHVVALAYVGSTVLAALMSVMAGVFLVRGVARTWGWSSGRASR